MWFPEDTVVNAHDTACPQLDLGRTHMMRPSRTSALVAGLVPLVLVAMGCPDAQAVPSFTRQTGLKCNVCHSNPPELTAFGRKFKLEGYTLTEKRRPRPSRTRT